MVMQIMCGLGWWNAIAGLPVPRAPFGGGAMGAAVSRCGGGVSELILLFYNDQWTINGFYEL
jgi:hypothetical protein